MREKNFILPQPLFYTPFIGIYGIIGISELLSRLFPEDLNLLHLLAKPLIMLSLFGYFLYTRKGPKGKADRIMLGAICFSFLGDVFLMFSGQQYFLLGLGSFLCAQMAYVLIFRMDRKKLASNSSPISQKHRWFAIPIILFGAFMLSSLWSYLGEMQIPVLVYSVVIISMGIAALDRYGAVSKRSFWMVFIGALLFIFSDSLIAYSRFGKEVIEISLPGFWVMLTYILAQFMIITGWMDSVNLEPEATKKI